MLFCLITAAGIIIADQISKLIALYFLPEVGESVNIISGVFSLQHVENRGALAGSFADQRWVFMIVSTIAIVAIIVYIWKAKPQSIWQKLPLAFVLGGGVGNMIDRVFRGSVTDFINFEFLPFPSVSFEDGFSIEITDFPVFNIADCFITVGCIWLVIYLLFVELPVEIKAEKAKKKEQAEGPSEEDNENGKS